MNFKDLISVCVTGPGLAPLPPTATPLYAQIDRSKKSSGSQPAGQLQQQNYTNLGKLRA
jgi:hypothetical protein